MSKLTANQENIVAFLTNTRTGCDLNTIAEQLNLKVLGVRSSLNSLLKKGLVILNDRLYSTTTENNNVITTEKTEVTMKKSEPVEVLTKAQKAAAKAAETTETTEVSQEVTLEEALAEEGKTTDDIGKKEKSEKVEKPKAPKKETVTRADGVEVPGYPRPGGKTRQVWDILDAAVGAAMAAYHGDGEESAANTEALTEHALDRKSLTGKCVEAGINPATVSTQYAQWRQFHMAKANWAAIELLQNVLAKVVSDKKAAEKAAADKVKADEKTAKAEAKAKEKALKAEVAEKVKTEKAEAKTAEKAAKAAKDAAAAKEAEKTTEAPSAE